LFSDFTTDRNMGETFGDYTWRTKFVTT